MDDSINFESIEKAITFLKTNYKNYPTLTEIAEHINLSPSLFQQLLTEWSGISPNKAIQFLRVEYVKSLLKDKSQPTLFDTAISKTGIPPNLFIKIEGMTPDEFKYESKPLTISYSFAETIFGICIIASTTKGICFLEFTQGENSALDALKSKFTNATLVKECNEIQKNALQYFTKGKKELAELKLHVKGTEFQLKVWHALLSIPSGSVTTYHNLAKQVNQAKASRAVGSAVGDNPVAFLIPCHRVILSTGEIGQYHWGSNRKTAIIGWEAAQLYLE